MKDAKGHGSNAHSSGVDQIGRAPLTQPGTWYHGSPLGEPGAGPVHVGTAEAAKQALEARIGIPADGKGWSGDREYGKTLLAGTDTMDKMGRYPTGFNCGAPKQDYYPKDRNAQPILSPGTPFNEHSRPAVASYNIVGGMSNNPTHPTTDTRANAMQGRLKNQGTYYKNIGEDADSISAVLPSKSFLRRVT